MGKAKRQQDALFTNYHVDEARDGQTITAALRELAKECSWGQAKKWLLNRHVQINGNLCVDAARRVKLKDVIKVWHQPLAKPIEARDLNLAFWDQHLLVVEKPPGVTSVRHFEERHLRTKRRQLQPTLEELLPIVLAKVQHVSWPPPTPGRRPLLPKSERRRSDDRIINPKQIPSHLQVIPVHRLDRDTSGLMLFARTHIAEQKLVALFKNHRIDREYVAVVIGRVEPQTIQSKLIRNRGDGQRGSAQHEEDDGQEAITHVVSSEFFTTPEEPRGYSLIRCRLETGRTHQIRIHLSEAGHILCGEKIYNRTADGKVMVDHSGAPRHALHSDRLSFTHPITQEKLTFHMSMPRDLASWYGKLRKSEIAPASQEATIHDEEE